MLACDFAKYFEPWLCQLFWAVTLPDILNSDSAKYIKPRLCQIFRTVTLPNIIEPRLCQIYYWAATLPNILNRDSARYFEPCLCQIFWTVTLPNIVKPRLCQIFWAATLPDISNRDSAKYIKPWLCQILLSRNSTRYFEPWLYLVFWTVTLPTILSRDSARYFEPRLYLVFWTVTLPNILNHDLFWTATLPNTVFWRRWLFWATTLPSTVFIFARPPLYHIQYSRCDNLTPPTLKKRKCSGNPEQIVEDRAEPQQIVATRPLYCLQHPLPIQVVCKRFFPAHIVITIRKLGSKPFRLLPIARQLWYTSIKDALFLRISYKRDQHHRFQHRFWLRGVQPLSSVW